MGVQGPCAHSRITCRFLTCCRIHGDFRRLWCTLWHWGSSSAISDWNLPRRPQYRVGLRSFWSLQNPLTLRIRWLDLILWRQWHLPQNVGAKRSLPLQHLSCQTRWVMAVIKGHCENGRKIRPGNGTHPRSWSAGVEATNQNNNVNMQVAIYFNPTNYWISQMGRGVKIKQYVKLAPSYCPGKFLA